MRRLVLFLVLMSGISFAQIMTGGGGGGGGSVGPPGPAGEVTSPAGAYTVDGLVLFNATSGDSIKTTTGTGFPFLSSGVVSTVGTTGTGAVVLSIAPSFTGNVSMSTLTSQAASNIDFSASGYMRIPFFTTGAPAADCDEASEVGKLRLRSNDTSVSSGGIRVCQQGLGATYVWSPASYRTGATAPGFCTVGDIWVDTDATLGQQLYTCSTGNVWTLSGDGGGGGTIATTTSALRGNGAGGAVAVTGTPTNCVSVAGTEVPCGSGPGTSGGVGFTMTMAGTPDNVVLTATRLINFQRGKEVTTIQSGETFTWTNPTSASGTFIIYYNGGMVLSSDNITIGSQSTTSSRPISNTANASTGLQLPQGAIPLFAGTVTTNNFVPASITNIYAGDSAGYIMDVDSSMTMTPVGNDTLRFSVSAVSGTGTGTGYSIVPSAFTGAALQTAINSVPAAGGTVWVRTGTYPFGSTGVTVPEAKNKVHILCEPGAVFTYSGTGAAFQVGGDMGNTEYFRMEGCEINLSGNSNATAIGLKMIRSFWGNVTDIKVMSSNGAASGIQTGIALTGGDGCAGAPGCGSPSEAGFSAYNIFTNVAIIGSWLKGYYLGSEITPSPASRDRSNRNSIIGGSVYSSAVSKTGTIGIHIEHGDTNYVLQTDMDSVATGVKTDSANNHITVKCEGPTVSLYCVHVSATSQGTYVAGVNAATGRFLDQGFETQFILASQGGVLASRLANLRAMYSFQLDPRPDTPATLSDGMMWYDYTLNKFRCRENGVTTDCIGAGAPTAADTAVFSERQEFTYYIGTTAPWAFGGGAQCITTAPVQPAENGHPGITRVSTGATSGNSCEYYYASVVPNTEGVLPPIGSTGVFASYVNRMIFRTNADVSSISIAALLSKSAGSTALAIAQDSIGFRVDNVGTPTCTAGATSIPTGRWYFWMRATGASTYCIDTALDASTLSIAANTWYEPVFWSTAPGTVNFGVKVNGGAIKAYGTSSTSISNAALKPSLLVQTQTAASRTVDIDFWSGYITGLVR